MAINLSQKDTRTAIIGLGYGDSVSRGWKEVLVSGQRAPLVNYFMDTIIVDITNIRGTVKNLTRQ